MKLILITYNEAIDDEVSEVLGHCGLEYYTKWQRVLGKGKLSGSHLGTSVWPGQNNVLAVVCEDDKIKTLLCCIRDLRKKLGKEGIKAFVLPVEEVV
ncbi:MAG: transcriptional regulator [Candidatus Omnitrophica bacterium]|nr:transcriptional regulator [Candidatus Omnitrophota bacterium]